MFSSRTSLFTLQRWLSLDTRPATEQWLPDVVLDRADHPLPVKRHVQPNDDHRRVCGGTMQPTPDSIVTADEAKRVQHDLRDHDARENDEGYGDKQQAVQHGIDPDLPRQSAEVASHDVDNPFPVQRKMQTNSNLNNIQIAS